MPSTSRLRPHHPNRSWAADRVAGAGARRKRRARQNVDVERYDPEQHTEPAEAADPAAAADPAEAADPAALGEQERGTRLEQLERVMDLMRPAVQADGGDLVLVSADVESGVVEVRLQGACSSCAISSATLQGGVERILRDRLPWVTEVNGGVTETFDPYESAVLGKGAYVPRF